MTSNQFNNYKKKVKFIRKLYKHEDYVRCLLDSQRLLKIKPISLEIEQIATKSKAILANKDIKWAIFVILIVLVASAISLSYIIKDHKQKIYTAQRSINALVEEIGSLKESSLENHLSAKVIDLKLKKISADLINLSVQFKDKTSYENELTNIKSDLEKSEQDLEMLRNLISLKDRKLQTLSQNATIQQLTDSQSLVRDSYQDILFLGMRGNLSDTIITATINPKLKTVTFISIPRDLLYNGRKINQIYSKFGIEEFNNAIYTITGIYPEKYLVFDFNSFTEIIDSLGGIDINVEKDIFDNQYPGPNYTYTTFSISKGLQHLNGETALKYVRTRKSTSDFARALRQQQVISAVIGKVKQHPVLMNDLKTTYQVYASILASITTNLDVMRALGIFYEYKDFKIEKDNVLSSSNFLYGTADEVGQYILLPKDGTYEEIKRYVKGLVEE